MQVLLGAATLFFCCCRVAAFGSQDLGFRTSIFGSHDWWSQIVVIDIWLSWLTVTNNHDRYLALTIDGHRQSWSIFGSHDWQSQTDGHKLMVADWWSHTDTRTHRQTKLYIRWSVFLNKLMLTPVN
jgi:hypothetical protein